MDTAHTRSSAALAQKRPPHVPAGPDRSPCSLRPGAAAPVSPAAVEFYGRGGMTVDGVGTAEYVQTPWYE